MLRPRRNDYEKNRYKKFVLVNLYLFPPDEITQNASNRLLPRMVLHRNTTGKTRMG